MAKGTRTPGWNGFASCLQNVKGLCKVNGGYLRALSILIRIQPQCSTSQLTDSWIWISKITWPVYDRPRDPCWFCAVPSHNLQRCNSESHIWSDVRLFWGEAIHQELSSAALASKCTQPNCQIWHAASVPPHSSPAPASKLSQVHLQELTWLWERLVLCPWLVSESP